MNPVRWVRTKAYAHELRAYREKLMGHKAKTWVEGLLLAVALGLFDYAARNVALLLGSDVDRRTFVAGLGAAAIVVARVYVAARYATPPDVKEKIDAGTFPERRDLTTRQERVSDEALAEKIVAEVKAERKGDEPIG